MNKSLFNTKNPSLVPVANTRNEAGGLAYSLSDQEALTQLIVTGTFQNTFYSSGSEQLGKVLELAKKCDPVFVAKLAVYARNQAFMKDAPAVLTAYLSMVDAELFKITFEKVINNGNMLRKFISVMRSGLVGRKSLGNLPKKMVQKLLNGRGEEWLFRNAIGNDPSFNDIIKMVHPKAKSPSINNMFAYLLDRKYDTNMLPDLVASYEAFKKNPSEGMPPSVDFRLLSNIKMTTDQWVYLLKGMSWTTLRMNLNMLMRNGVFNTPDAVKYAAKTLMNKEQIVAAKAFPFQIYNTIRNTPGMPPEITRALETALEVSLVIVVDITCFMLSIFGNNL
jgi:60 kDa SS-A/Ro ribonucleoprotein